MKNKPYKLGILVGRFQTIHSGHEYMIDKALELCDEVGVFIGSSQESGTFKNPFSYEMRRELLTVLYADRIRICPLPDIGVGNTSKWGDYVLKNVLDNFERLPDLLVSGKEDRRSNWFSSNEGDGISELYVPKIIDISASEMRNYFIEDNKEEWMKYTNPLLWDKYDTMREAVISSKDNLDTKSI